MTFATIVQTIFSPYGIIGLLVLLVIFLTIGKRMFNNVISRLIDIRGTQVDRASVQTGTLITLATLNGKLDKISNNHLHELPEMRIDITEIKVSMKEISNQLNVQGNRLTRVETKLNL